MLKLRWIRRDRCVRRRLRWRSPRAVTTTTTATAAAAAAVAAGRSGSIALLLPESKTARYESQDRPNFEARAKELCPDCEIIYSNADQDAASSSSRLRRPSRTARRCSCSTRWTRRRPARSSSGRSRQIPVISYDRLITDADIDYYISFDNEQVGKLQGESLVKKLEEDGAKGDIIMINGAPTDNNAKLFKKGAHSVIDGSDFKVAKEYDTPDWSPDKAQQEMEQAITAVGKDGFVGVYAANDGTAGGAIAAMKGNGVDPKKIPVTGQDAELAAIQRILIGEQYMTVYKAIKPEAEAAAELAVRSPRARSRSSRSDRQRHEAGAVDSARAGRGHQGQHQRHDREGRVLVGGRDLHRQVRGGLQVGWHPVGAWGRMGASSRAPPAWKGVSE